MSINVNELSPKVGNARRALTLALSELSVDLQQHGKVRDQTKDQLKEAKKLLDEVVKDSGSVEEVKAEDQNQPVPGQASVPDVPSQP